MPDQIVAAKALERIEEIVFGLIGSFDSFSADVQAQLRELYAAMREQYEAAARSQELEVGDRETEDVTGLRRPAPAAAVVAFLEALDAMPEVRNVLGPLLDATKARQRSRGLEPTVRSPALDALLDRLPGELERPARANGGGRARREAPSPFPEVFDVPSGGGGDIGSLSAGAAPPNVEAAAPPAESVPPAGFAPLTATASPPEADTAAVRPPLTRYAELDYPSQVVVGVRTSLTVSLLRHASDTQAATAGIVIEDVAATGELPNVEVVLRTRGFDIEPSNTQIMEVARDDDSDVRFVLIPREAGAQKIRVDFYQNGRRIGTAEHLTRIVPRPNATLDPQPAVLRSQPVATLEFASASAAPCDLEICVETDPRNEQVLYFTLHSTKEEVDYHHSRMGSVRLQGSPLAKMQAVYGELSKLAGAPPTAPDDVAYQRRRLARLGNQLWDELFSPELKAAYWQWKDHVETVLITSDEPWIPWEIVKPYTFDQNNVRVDEPHLCEHFTVARWLSGPGPADRVPVQRVQPVAPAEVDLDSVQAELQYLQQISQLRPGIMPDTPYGDRNRVIDLFENGSFSVLHFAAHGSFDAQTPDNSGITLTGGELHPSDILARFGGVRPRPLVFINACHGARAEYAFTGLGGWADRLVRQAHVAAFVGAAWEVNDRLALMFAEEFYTALLRDEKTIGESFRIARQKIRDAEPSNSTWLAYVLYADPVARALVRT